jgi:hypothetical protein
MGEFFVAYDPDSWSKHFGPKMQNFISQFVDVPKLSHDVLHFVFFGVVPFLRVCNPLDELYCSIYPNAGKDRLCGWAWDASKMPYYGLQCCFDPRKYGYKPTKRQMVLIGFLSNQMADVCMY